MSRVLRILPLLVASLSPASLCAQTRAQTSTSSSVRFAYGEKLHIAGVSNPGKISEHLYRGGQPKSTGLLELKKLGITTVVDLREEDLAKIHWEDKKSQSLGMHFVHIPVDGWSPPTDQQVARFLSIFRGNPKEIVFVHCHYGDDRTGVFVATYRMAVENAAPQQALKEMYYFGFNGFWHPSMAAFVQHFPAHLATSPPLLPFKNTD